MAGTDEGRLVWLLRHAMTEVDPPPGGTDHDRVLTPGGWRDAEALGRRLATDRLGFAVDQLPSVVLCSTARRTMQTAQAALSGIGVALDLRCGLYRAAPDDVLDEVRTVDDDALSMMVVGHNPTIHQLAVAMIADADEAGRRTVHGKFPTTGVAVYRVPAARWRDVAEGTASVVGCFAPPY